MRISDWSSDVCSSDLDQRLDTMTAQIGHERGQRLVVKAVEQLLHIGLAADIGHQPRAPRRSALIGERSIVRIRAVIDPVFQRLPAGLLERGLLKLAVLHGDRKTVGEGKGGAVRVDLGGRRTNKKKK